MRELGKGKVINPHTKKEAVRTIYENRYGGYFCIIKNSAVPLKVLEREDQIENSKFLLTKV